MNIADYLKKDIIYWPNWINYILLKMNVFGKLVYGFSYINMRNQIEKQDPEKLLIESVNHAIKNVKYYRDRYGDLRINSIDEFKSKIGFIDKDEVMNHWDDFLIDNIDLKKCNIGTTGGTSGKALKLVIPQNRYIRESAFIHKIRENSYWKVGKVRGMIRNNHIPSNKDYIINPITKDIIFDSFRMDQEYAKVIYEILKKFKIKVIHAYPSAVYQFFKLCEKQNLDLNIIKTCLLSSETLTDEQFWYFTNHLNIEINFTYGHSEKLILASNESNNNYLLVEPNYGYFELIDKKGKQLNSISEIGEMVGTTFFNKYMPLIRYKTGDFAEYGGVNQSNDGSKKTKLNKIYGRWDKSIIYKANDTTTSLTSLNLHGDFYNHIDGMQYIQEIKGYITVLIIKNKEYTKDDYKFILDHIANAMGGERYVNIKYVDKLIIQHNGKFLPIISYV